MRLPQEWNDRTLLEDEPFCVIFATLEEGRRPRGRLDSGLVEDICQHEDVGPPLKKWLDQAFAGDGENLAVRRGVARYKESPAGRALFVQFFWELYQTRGKKVRDDGPAEKLLAQARKGLNLGYMFTADPRGVRPPAEKGMDMDGRKKKHGEGALDASAGFMAKPPIKHALPKSRASKAPDTAQSPPSATASSAAGLHVSLRTRTQRVTPSAGSLSKLWNPASHSPPIVTTPKRSQTCFQGAKPSKAALSKLKKKSTENKAQQHALKGASDSESESNTTDSENSSALSEEDVQDTPETKTTRSGRRYVPLPASPRISSGSGGASLHSDAEPPLIESVSSGRVSLHLDLLSEDRSQNRGSVYASEASSPLTAISDFPSDDDVDVGARKGPNSTQRPPSSSLAPPPSYTRPRRSTRASLDVKNIAPPLPPPTDNAARSAPPREPPLKKRKQQPPAPATSDDGVRRTEIQRALRKKVKVSARKGMARSAARVERQRSPRLEPQNGRGPARNRRSQPSAEAGGTNAPASSAPAVSAAAGKKQAEHVSESTRAIQEDEAPVVKSSRPYFFDMKIQKVKKDVIASSSPSTAGESRNSPDVQGGDLRDPVSKEIGNTAEGLLEARQSLDVQLSQDGEASAVRLPSKQDCSAVDYGLPAPGLARPSIRSSVHTGSPGPGDERLANGLNSTECMPPSPHATPPAYTSRPVTRASTTSREAPLPADDAARSLPPRKSALKKPKHQPPVRRATKGKGKASKQKSASRDLSLSSGGADSVVNNGIDSLVPFNKLESTEVDQPPPQKRRKTVQVPSVPHAWSNPNRPQRVKSAPYVERMCTSTVGTAHPSISLDKANSASSSKKKKSKGKMNEVMACSDAYPTPVSSEAPKSTYVADPKPKGKGPRTAVSRRSKQKQVAIDEGHSASNPVTAIPSKDAGKKEPVVRTGKRKRGADHPDLLLPSNAEMTAGSDGPPSAKKSRTKVVNDNPRGVSDQKKKKNGELRGRNSKLAPSQGLPTPPSTSSKGRIRHKSCVREADDGRLVFGLPSPQPSFSSSVHSPFKNPPTLIRIPHPNDTGPAPILAYSGSANLHSLDTPENIEGRQPPSYQDRGRFATLAPDPSCQTSPSKPSLDESRLKPLVWAYGRQALCESTDFFRSYQGGVYLSDNTARGYLLGGYPSVRDIFHHNGKLIISHGGGKRKAARGTGGVSLASDQHIEDASVRALIQNHRFNIPLALIVGGDYKLFPYTLDKAMYAVLGWYFVRHYWQEYQLEGEAFVIRYKFAFQWCDDQGAPWWWATSPPHTQCMSPPEGPSSSSYGHTISAPVPTGWLEGPGGCFTSPAFCGPLTTPSSRSMLPPGEMPSYNHAISVLAATASGQLLNAPRKVGPKVDLSKGPPRGNPALPCPSCGVPSPQVYRHWLCLSNSACPIFCRFPADGINTDSSMPLEYHPEILNISPNKDFFPSLPDIRPCDPSELADKNITTSEYYTRGWHCKKCGCLSSRVLWGSWECPDGCTELGILPTILEPHDIPRVAFAAPVVLPASGIVMTGPHRYEWPSLGDMEPGYSNYYTFILPDNKGKIHHILGSRTVNNQADDVFLQYQNQARNGSLDLRRHTKKKSAVVGPFLSNFFSHNSGEAYQWIGSSEKTTPFDQAPEAVKAALALIKARAALVLADRDPFNEILTVAYMERQDMKYHSDNETGLGPNVASLSLGSPAKMLFRPCSRLRKGTDAETGGKAHLALVLQHGDVLVMEGLGVQENYQHSVSPDNFRIAATARCIYPANAHFIPNKGRGKATAPMSRSRPEFMASPQHELGMAVPGDANMDEDKPMTDYGQQSHHPTHYGNVYDNDMPIPFGLHIDEDRPMTRHAQHPTHHGVVHETDTAIRVGVNMDEEWHMTGHGHQLQRPTYHFGAVHENDSAIPPLA